jgi:Uma2 family endonuclease
MSQARITRPRAETEPEPTWEVAYLFPAQGAWDEEDYLALDGNHLVEFSNGVLEVLPMPTTSHQMIVFYLARLLLAFTTSRDLGTVLLAPLPVRLWHRKFREPDVVFMSKEHADRLGEQFWTGADLVMEVVSGEGKDRDRDLVTKREEYARAGIAEYWLIDPREERLTVLRLARKRYVVHGEFGKGLTASSHLLPGFTVDVSEVLSQCLRQTAAAKTTRKPKPSSPR